MRYFLYLLLFSFSFQTAQADEIDVPEASPLPLRRQYVVLNGNLANESDQYQKFTVSLSIQSAQGVTQNTCTGIIIAEDMILTAGHCLKYPGLKVKIEFGLGGQKGFQHSHYSGMYISANPHPLNSNYNPWVDGFLTYNQGDEAKHFNEVRARTKLFNYVERSDFASQLIYDFAVVRISGLPYGYAPIEYAKSKKLKFGQKIYHVGFGTNSRKAIENNDALRWSEASLSGYYQPEKQPVLGYETFSTTQQQSCFGDSGGPLVIFEGKRIRLLGVNAFTYNNCANSNWYMSVGAFSKLINEAIVRLRAINQI